MPARRKTVRWGILGAAEIAPKNWRAIFNSGNGVVTAVASRDPARAKAFIAAQQADCPFDKAPVVSKKYQDLLARDDVDAIYCPLPTAVRHDWLLRAAAAGKHILSEKPADVHASLLKDVLQACVEAKLQYMDGVMFMHSARLPEIYKVLANEDQFGDLRRVTAGFSFLGEGDFFVDNIRTQPDLEPHGCLGDLGWYCIRMILWSLQEKLPRAVSGRMLKGCGVTPDGLGVPLEFSAEMFFDNDTSAGFHCSFLKSFQQWVRISGTQRDVVVDDFVLPRNQPQQAFNIVRNDLNVSGTTFAMQQVSEEVRVVEDGQGSQNSQEANMFRTFNQMVLGGKPDVRWGEWALGTQRVLDALRQSAIDEGRITELQP